MAGLSTREYVQRVLVTLLIVALALAIWELRGALMLTFLSAIIAVALSKPVSMLQKRGFSRGAAVLSTLVGVLLIAILIIVAIVPIFISQITDLVEELPTAIEDAQISYNEFAEDTGFLPGIGSGEIVSENEIVDFVVTQAGAASRSIFPFLSDVGGVVTNIFVVVTLSIFLLLEPNIYIEGVLTLVPRTYRARALEVMNALFDAISLSLASQVFAMGFIGIATVIGLIIIGVPNALALGVIAGLLAFIPTFGATIAIIFAIIFTLASAPDKIIFVILLYIILQQIESNILTPRIVKQTLNMPGAVVIVTQIAAGILFGFLGLILAVPLVAAVMVLVRELYVYDVLNSRKVKVEVVRSDNIGLPALRLTKNDPYRPDIMSPGEAASIIAKGGDPFSYLQEPHQIEIIKPAKKSRSSEDTRGQQAVWLAILALIGSQTLGIIRAILVNDNQTTKKPTD